LKIIVQCFHKRLLNLGLLKIIYFLKKEFKKAYIAVYHCMFKTKKLINILKSPIRNKSARNQFKFETYKLLLSFNVADAHIKYNLVKHLIFLYFFSIIKKLSLISYCNLFIKKMY
jgi:hypothetical protein